MKKTWIVAALAVFASAAVMRAEDKAAADAEKAKAMAEPFANDLGPDSLPKETLAAYPKDVQEGYATMSKKCTVCHSAARPLNSQFIEADGKTDDDRKKAVADLKKKDAVLFSDKNVWQIEDSIWKRYTKRMMAKPGCNISDDDGKKIWKFLSYDSRKRKIGDNKKSWEEHRKKLLVQLKDHKDPKFRERYKQLYEKK